MTKSKDRASAARSGTKSRSKGKRAKPVVHHKTRNSSKQAAVLALLSRPSGTTITAIHGGDRLAGAFGARLRCNPRRRMVSASIG